MTDSINHNFLEHVEKGNVEQVKNDLRDGANINYIEQFKKPALTVAVLNNDFNMVKYLVENGADANIRGALTEAAFIENLEITKYLLAQGACPNRQVSSGSLLSHVCMNITSEKEYVPISTENFTIAKLLIDAGADVNYRIGRSDPTIQAVQKRRSLHRAF